VDCDSRQARFVDPRRTATGARGPRCRLRDRRQHRRSHGHRQSRARSAARRGSSGAWRPRSTVLNTAAVLLDVGANVDCTAVNLEQVRGDGRHLLPLDFRHGASAGRPAFDWRRRRQGQQSDARSVFNCLKRLPINFIGNVEGRDLYNGHVDVIVPTDLSATLP